MESFSLFTSNSFETHLSQVFTSELQDVREECLKFGVSSFLLLFQESLECFMKKNFEKCLDICLELENFCWENLHHGHWKDVPLLWRRLNALISLLKGCCLLKQNEKENAKEVLKILDTSILMGIPSESLNKTITELIHSISNQLNSNHSEKRQRSSKFEEENEFQAPQSKIPKLEHASSISSFVSANIPSILPENQIERLSVPPSMEEFYKKYFIPQKPVIICGGIDHWPARNERAWSNLHYLKKVAGNRTVPIELGKNYLEKNWTQQLMTLSEFIDNYILKNNPIKGYLAQTQLFEQIPELFNDIGIPVYCGLSSRFESKKEIQQKDEEEKEGEDEDNLIINAWFGPYDTISPMHHDPYYNLLVQVVGEKYIRLYSSSENEKVYPYQDRMLHNSSQVDVENPDLKKFPLFSTAKFMETILKEGEMLFIPPKYWHYVRSLSISFSVSFWWD